MGLAVALPTPNGVNSADGIADSAAEAGKPCGGPFHVSHGALEPGLEAADRIGHKLQLLLSCGRVLLPPALGLLGSVQLYLQGLGRIQ